MTHGVKAEEVEFVGHPTVYPMGTTIYNPKCWNGYTLLSEMTAGAILVDMNRKIMGQTVVSPIKC